VAKLFESLKHFIDVLKSDSLQFLQPQRCFHIYFCLRGRWRTNAGRLFCRP